MHCRSADTTKPTPSAKPVGLRQASAPALLKAKPRAPQGLRRTVSLGASPTLESAELPVVSAARTVQRAVSGFFGITTPVPTALCQICFENVPIESTIELTECKHRYCGPCVKRYLELKIKEGNVFPVCFHPTEASNTTATGACGKRIGDAQLQAIVDREVWAKCALFRFNKANATARECPFCKHPQQCEGPEKPECTCEQCSRVFCFFHGNAHVNGSCADYELKHAETETKTRTTIARVTKPCPGCKGNVEKSGGCNHMTCVVCRTEFCWICNAKLESGKVTEHFSATNISGGCAGRQFDDVDASGHESLWGRFSRLHSAFHVQTMRRLYQVMNNVVYPLALLLALLIVGATRVRPIQAIANTPFSELVEWTRFGSACLAAFVVFVWTFTLLPSPVISTYSYVQQVKAFGDLAILAWPSIQPRLVGAWMWTRVRASQVRGRFQPRRLSDAPDDEPEREALFA